MRVKWLNTVWKFLIILIGIGFGLDLIAHFLAEKLWFEEIGFFPVFQARLTTQILLGAIALFLTGGFLGGNLVMSYRLQYPQPRIPDDLEPQNPKSISLGWLLLTILTLSLLLGFVLINYSSLIGSYWHSHTANLILPRLTVESLWKTILQLPNHPLEIAFSLGFPLIVILAPKTALSGVAVFLSVGLSFIYARNWIRVLEYLHPTSFNSTDPIFDHDIAFYVFTLPVIELLEFWLVEVCLCGLISAILLYLLSGDSLSRGRFPGFSPQQRRHLQAMSAGLMLSIALGYWLSRYDLLYSTNGVSFGASYTEVNAQLPLLTILSGFAGLWSLFLLGRAIKSFKKRNIWRPLLIVLVGYLAIAATTHYLVPWMVQRLVVQPNELERERPFIDYSITFTRNAFGLNNIEIQNFDPVGELTPSALQANAETLRNIRLWDTRPLLQTNRQLQEIRLYYKFVGADIDRYTLRRDQGTEKRQTIIAARELDYQEVPAEAQTWINQNLVYTHGYGFTLSPVNIADSGGLPAYFVRDIGTGGIGGEGNLWTASDRIRDSIPINNPRIYYGEITNTAIMTPTQAPEFDYPSGDENVYNNYDGRGGISIHSPWRKLVFATYLRNWQMLLSRDFRPETKILFRRNIQQRLQAIAPFLQFDGDPYLVAADTKAERGSLNPQPSYLYWIVDAYTISDRYPYSDPGDKPFNYIRNSVKAVVDAYHGDVQFFVADSTDPMIQTLAAIFPKMFQPLAAMPASLRSHIRYPVDLFKTQAERLLAYHMTDAQVFYNREDQWRVPMEIYGSEITSVEPYYLIMRLPTATEEEFILLNLFTPASRNNLIGWLAGRSDGENYGRLLLYRFPKQRLVYGPEQIEARINQDPLISEQISLWNREGSRALQGNLLVIPIEQSLLYVEPLYLEATQNSLPTLVRVIVAYENRIVMAETLQEALNSIFQPTASPGQQPIVRPLE